MLDRIIQFALHNRVFVLIFAVTVTILGVKAAIEMPVDVFPDLNRPTVTILTEAGGLAPEEVEVLITTPLETSVSGLPGVIRVRSTSSIGLSIVWVEFDWNTDLLTNRQLVSERLVTLDNALPEGIIPIMGPISSLMGEIMLVGMTSEQVSPMDLRSLADWTLKPRLQAIAGVSQIISIGGGVKQVHINLDTDKMRRFNVSFDTVREATQGIANNTTGGFVQGDHNEFLIRNIARPKTLEEIAATPVSVQHGVPLKIGDIATVSFGHQTKRGEAGVNGGTGVILAVQKQPGVNTVTLTEKIQDVLAELQPALPGDVKIVQLFKQATFIETAIHNVLEALRDGSLFVAIVLFLFLLNFRTTSITLTAIPLSLVVTFLIFQLFGISINTMTLGGLAVAIGELVDDAIVDVENVFRRLRENRQLAQPLPAIKVIFSASSEVRNSIVMATIIVVLVFMPLFALSGLEGRLFIPLGLAYVISILVSLLVSLTVTPVLCYYLLPKSKATESEEDGAFVAWLKKHNRNLLEKSLDRPKEVIVLSLATVVLAISSVFFLGSEFLPPFNEGTVTAFVVTPPGTSIDESSRVGRLAEQELLKVPEVVSAGRRTGRAEQDEHAEGVYNTEIDLELKESNRSRTEILADMRERLAAIPGIGVSLGQPISHRIDHMMSGVKAQIAIKIFGPDMPMLRKLGAEVRDAIAGVPGLVDLQVEKVTVVPQIQIIPDVEKAGRFGLSPGKVAEWLEHALDGSHPIGEMIDGLVRTPILLKLDDKYEESLATLENIYIDTPAGGKVPLRALAKVQRNNGPNQINHENSRRRIVVMANTQDRDLSSVVGDIQARVAEKIKFPEGYYVNYGGQFESQMTAMRSILLLSLFSFAGIFLVLYLYFKSAFIALQIILNIPMALIGSVVAVYFTGAVMSIGTLVGFITLCGIASRNGIMMISHYIHLMAHEGHKFDREMVIKGSLERLVPVLMTALTATLALLPIAAAGGTPGKEILHPVAIVILGGLVSSTLLNILVTPTLFFNFTEKACRKAVADAKREKGADDAE